MGATRGKNLCFSQLETQAEICSTMVCTRNIEPDHYINRAGGPLPKAGYGVRIPTCPIKDAPAMYNFI